MMQWTADICAYQARFLDRQQIWVPGWTPLQLSLTWEGLCRSLTRFRAVTQKMRAPAWSPVRLRGFRRANADVVHVSCVVLDVDDGTPITEVAERMEAGVYITHTSWSHTTEHPKGRLVIPLEAPVPLEYWPLAWRHVQRMAGQAADEAAKDASRLYFLPAHLPGTGEHHSASVADDGGPMMDLRPFDRFLPPPPRKPIPRAWRPSDLVGADREKRKRYNEDPSTRQALGLQLGGTLRTDRVVGVPCPECGDSSVWWPLSPSGTPHAMCNHRNSCGWHDWLDTLEQT